MYLLYLLAAIAIIITLICVVVQWKEYGFEDAAVTFIGGLAVSAIGVAFFFFFIGVIVGEFKDTAPVYVKTADQEMISVRDDIGINGSFFLGIGSIDTDAYYVYYVRTGENSFVQQRIEANNVTIIEDAPPGTGRALWYRDKGPILHDWYFDLGHDSEYDDKDFYIELHVPEGTIIRNFVLE